MRTPATLFGLALVWLGASPALSAHPMGNFSVNHYSRLYFRDSLVDLTYVLDLAEIPAFELLGQWQIDWKDQALLAGKSERQAKQWVANLMLSQGGRPLPLHVISVSAKAVEGAGGMPVLRISIAAQASLQPGEVAYQDRNYPGRAGWKEIVVDHNQSAVIRSSSQPAKDLSGGLTYYPADPAITPPQDLTARVNFTPAFLPPVLRETVPAAPPQAASPSFSQQQPAAPGTVVRGDYLSKLLQRHTLEWRTILFGILAAFGLGAIHAMSPGHGKTIVAAYLVGSRGTLKHAGLLGFVVTFTHTFTVFLLGLGVLFFQQYVVPEKIVPILGVISGLSIVSVGAMLLYRRSSALMDGEHSHHHHNHSHNHNHQYARRKVGQPILAAAGSQTGLSAVAELIEADHDSHDRHHGSGALVHSHGGHTHAHMVEGKVTLSSLIALGISGGLVPCPSALILMLSAIALGHPGLGLVLLIGFSSGLAGVLMGIGMLALYARHLLPDGKETSRRPIFRLIPVFSAVVVICLGLAMSAVSAGWVQPLRFLS
jgi:nickel/cobalt exporter